MFPTEGMAIIGNDGHRKITFSSTVTLGDMRSLIVSLRERGGKISLYDTSWPSPSDPGAYFDYSHEKALPGCWSMTFGNHGWSGGIYQIDDDTIAIQCFDLLRKKKLESLAFEDGNIFSHYDPESTECKAKMTSELRALHSDTE